MIKNRSETQNRTPQGSTCDNIESYPKRKSKKKKNLSAREILKDNAKK